MAAVAVAEEYILVVDGTLCYVQYVEPGVEDPPYTEVLVLYELEYDDYVVANPDQEVRIEHLSLDNPDVQSFKFVNLMPLCRLMSPASKFMYSAGSRWPCAKVCGSRRMRWHVLNVTCAS